MIAILGSMDVLACGEGSRGMHIKVVSMNVVP